MLRQKKSGRERERERDRDRKEKRGVGYATAVSPRGIRVLDSHPRSRSPSSHSPPVPSRHPCLQLSLFPAASLRARPSWRVPTALYPGLTRKGRRDEREMWRSRGKRWLRHKPAIPARMTGDYVIRRDVRVPVCTGFACPFIPYVPRVFYVTPDLRTSRGLPALIHPIKFNFERCTRRLSSIPLAGRSIC